MRHSSEVFTASTPWSKSSPRGPLWCVLRLRKLSVYSSDLCSLIVSLRLCSINCIKGLIKKQSQRPTCIYPRRTILIECWIIPQQGQHVDYHETETSQRDEIRCHPHGKTSYNNVGVEWFENISRKERVVDAGILVLFQTGKLVLSQVNHCCGCRGGVDGKGGGLSLSECVLGRRTKELFLCSEAQVTLSINNFFWENQTSKSKCIIIL